MKIIWTDFAVKNLKIIFDYYSDNAGREVAHKIRRQILNSAKQLNKNPELGQIEFFLEKLDCNHRYILSGKYKLIYIIVDKEIIITDVFDARQSPEKMNDTNR
ncbi:MAG: type II toxin-antitoxin system RelE/ParE family toxin [Bacteroidia bacterium]